MRPLLEKTRLPNTFSPTSLIPEELTKLRSDMLKFARLQLRDDSAAEDAVQEALAAALAGLKGFKEEAQLKTWVFAILKNKIIDTMRERRKSPIAWVEIDGISEGAIDELFDQNGRWHDDFRPSDWGDPELSFSNRQFWQVFETCLDRLPESSARIFMMREMLGFETDEICTELNISSANCWVILHRARMSLRLCLNERWFMRKGQQS
jgi:RNA polymerase sigma-70 factor, ECF subfamily